MSEAFAFDEVDKRFASRDGACVTALSGLTFRGELGAVTCLLGPTGCGKTTALRLAAGLEEPDGGCVLINGRAPTAHRAALAYIPQQHTLLPWLRLVDNVALPSRVRGVCRKERRRQAGGFLARVGLDGKERLYPHECSGGMQQRAMLARQLASGATSWLMDEPFAALDERTRYALQDVLLELRATRGLSVLFVTHSIVEATYLADRIVVLSVGPGRASDVIDVELSHPRDRLGAAFSGLAERVRRELDAIVLSA